MLLPASSHQNCLSIFAAVSVNGLNYPLNGTKMVISHSVLAHLHSKQSKQKFFRKYLFEGAK